MRTVVGKPDMRALTWPLLCKTIDGEDAYIPIDFEWDGSSSPFLVRGIFPRHRHPVASCRHDYRCRNGVDRAWSDKEFRKDVAATSWPITAWFGYAGVRIGALLGIGVCKD